MRTGIPLIDHCTSEALRQLRESECSHTNIIIKQNPDWYDFLHTLSSSGNYSTLLSIRSDLQELLENLVLIGELRQCPSCSHIDESDCFTYLCAGFNGIQEGDEDDLNMFECHSCGHKFKGD